MEKDDEDPEAAQPPDPTGRARRPRRSRVLHTRVPEVLEQELKRLAVGLRVPVSNVVRAILEDAVEAMDAVGQKAGDELRDVADRLSGEGAHAARRRRRKGRGAKGESAPLSNVVGYQALLLARDERCALCGRELVCGSDAFVGIRDVPGPRVILGAECLPSSTRPEVSPERSAGAEEEEES